MNKIELTECLRTEQEKGRYEYSVGRRDGRSSKKKR